MSKFSYHPPPAAGLNHQLFDDYSPPPYYLNDQEPPPYHYLYDQLDTVLEDPIRHSLPGSRHPILPENEDVFFSDSLPSSMGSASSMMTDARFYKEEKLSSGIKQKIKNSFDKLKPFSWGSNDKLDLAFSKKYKKNSTKPNMRRYSDSIAPASIDSTYSILSKRPESSSSYSGSLIRKINVNDTPAMPPRRPLKKTLLRSYFAVGKQPCAQKSTPQTEEYLSINIGGDSFVVNKSKHTESRQKEQNAYVPLPAAPYQRGTNFGRNNQYHNSQVGPHDTVSYNPDAQNKPKGTWSVLKMSAKQPTPPNPSKYLKMSNEVPPPKITPVSGQLLTNENMKGSIIRPTAYKPANSPHTDHFKWSDQVEQNNLVESTCEGTSSAHSSSFGSHDEGRSSTASLTRNEFYSGSEGYESARVSSSTVPEHHSDQESSNEKPFTDDVILRSLESNIQTSENEILGLRRSLGTNVNALHRVLSDQPTMDSEQINTSDAQKTLSTVDMQIDLHSKCRMLLQEKRRLQELNLDLEDQISSVLSETSSAMNEYSTTTTVLEEKLEDMKWEMQQKCGEISLLKGQLRECKAELERRNVDLVSQISKTKQIKKTCNFQERITEQLNDKLLISENQKLVVLQDLSNTKLKLADVKKQLESSDANQHHKRSPNDQQLVNKNAMLSGQVDRLKNKVTELSHKNEQSKRMFETEKQKWTDEKNKVLRYQQMLQTSYLDMKKRCESLETQMNEILQKLPESNQDNVAGALSFPTEI